MCAIKYCCIAGIGNNNYLRKVKSLKKRIIAVIGTVLLTTLFLNGSNTEAVIKPPVIFVGNENVTGG